MRILWITLLALLGNLILAGEAPQQAPDSSSGLFQTTKVWDIHLKFTAKQFAAMEPEGGFGPGGRGPGGPGGGPGGRGGPFGGMRPSGMFLPTFLKGDVNKDGSLSAEEFQKLGQSWFSSWSKQSTDLSAEQLRNGLQQTFPMPAFGPPGGGPGGPGGPGGGPGRGFMGQEGGRNGMSAMSGIDFQYVPADLEFENRTFTGVAARYKGNNTFQMSRNSIKRSLKIDLNKYDKTLKLADQTTLNLHNNVTDGGWMNEVLSYRLFRDAGVPAPRTSYARVYITVPGKYERQYFGLYSIVENIDKSFAKERYGSGEGAIFKPVTRELFSYIGDDWSRYNQMYDPKTKLTDAQKARVIAFAKFLKDSNDADFAAKIGTYLDLDEFARFMAATVLLSNMDSILAMGQNFYVYLHPETNKFQVLPWDLDHSFGQFPMGGGSDNLSIDKPWQGQNRFLERVFQVEAFKKQYRARLTEFNSTIFKPQRIAAQVDEVAAAIRPAVMQESETKLTRFDSIVAGKSVAPEGRGGPGGFGGPGGPGGFGAMKPIKPFVVARNQSVADQLAGKQVEANDNRRGGGPGRGGFNPAMMLERGFLQAFDSNKDDRISADEFNKGFKRWFESWNSDHSGKLTEEQLRSGIEKDLLPMPGPGGPGGPPGFGPGPNRPQAPLNQ